MKNSTLFTLLIDQTKAVDNEGEITDNKNK